MYILYTCICILYLFDAIATHVIACEAATLASRSWSSGQKKTANGPSWELTDLAVSHDAAVEHHFQGDKWDTHGDDYKDERDVKLHVLMRLPDAFTAVIAVWQLFTCPI